MGSCLSKKTHSNQLNLTKESSLILTTKNEIESKNQNNKVVVAVRNQNEGKEQQEEEKEVKNIKEEVVKQELQEQEKCQSASVVKHRKSQGKRAEGRCSSPEKSKNLVISEPERLNDCTLNCELATGVRTSSCTREELDAILIKCGRLSRSNSGVNQRKYSGSKRSFDFDQNEDSGALDDSSVESAKKEECDDVDDKRQHGQRRHQTNRLSSPGRRRTPSREREQRSGSRERTNGGGSGRRISRSPGRRSENGKTCTNSSNTNVGDGGDNVRPVKMVSVPASVIEKGDNGVESQPFKKVSMKRNASGGAVAASPRSESPARTNGGNDSKAATNRSYNQQQQQKSSPGHSYTRKAEYSPYRRNPLSEINSNSLAHTQVAGNKVNKNKDIDAMVKDSMNIQQIQVLYFPH